MLEGIVADLLSGTLGHYVKIDKRQISLGLWSGVLEFQDLELRTEAFGALWERLGLNFPVQVLTGVIGRLVIDVPWKTLGWSQPLRVTVQDVFVLVTPATSFTSTAEASSRSQRLRQSQLASDASLREAQLRAWLFAVREGALASDALRARLDSAARALLEDANANSSNLSGWRRRLLRRVLENIQFQVANVWVRFVDASTAVDMGSSDGTQGRCGGPDTPQERSSQQATDTEPCDSYQQSATQEQIPRMDIPTASGFDATAGEAHLPTGRPAVDRWGTNPKVGFGATTSPEAIALSTASVPCASPSGRLDSLSVDDKTLVTSEEERQGAASNNDPNVATTQIPELDPYPTNSTSTSMVPAGLDTVSVDERECSGNRVSSSVSSVDQPAVQVVHGQSDGSSTSLSGNPPKKSRIVDGSPQPSIDKRRERVPEIRLALNLYMKQLRLDSCPAESAVVGSTAQAVVSVSKQITLSSLTIFEEHGIHRQRWASWHGDRPSILPLAEMFAAIQQDLEAHARSCSEWTYLLAPLDMSIALRLCGEPASLLEGNLPSSLDLRIQLPRLKLNIEHDLYQQLAQTLLHCDETLRSNHRSAQRGPRERWWNALEAMLPGFWARRRAAALKCIDSVSRRRQEREKYVRARLHVVLDRLLEPGDPLRAQLPIAPTEATVLDELDRHLELDTVLFYRHLADIQVVEVLSSVFFAGSAAANVTPTIETTDHVVNSSPCQSQSRELAATRDAESRPVTGLAAEASVSPEDKAVAAATAMTVHQGTGVSERNVQSPVSLRESSRERQPSIGVDSGASTTSMTASEEPPSHDHWARRLRKRIRLWFALNRDRPVDESVGMSNRVSGAVSDIVAELEVPSAAATASASATRTASSRECIDAAETEATVRFIPETIQERTAEMMAQETASSSTLRGALGPQEPAQSQQVPVMTPFEVALLSELMGYDYPTVPTLDLVAFDRRPAAAAASVAAVRDTASPDAVNGFVREDPSTHAAATALGEVSSGELEAPHSIVVPKLGPVSCPGKSQMTFVLGVFVDQCEVAFWTPFQGRSALQFAARGFRCTIRSGDVTDLVLQYCTIWYTESSRHWTLLDWRQPASSKSSTTQYTNEPAVTTASVSDPAPVVTCNIWRGIMNTDASSSSSSSETTTTTASDTHPSSTSTERLPAATVGVSDIERSQDDEWYDAIDDNEPNWFRTSTDASLEGVLNIRLHVLAPQLCFYGHVPFLEWLKCWRVDWSANAALKQAAIRRLWRIRSHLQHSLPQYVPCCALSLGIWEPSLSIFGRESALNGLDVAERPEPKQSPLLTIRIDRLWLENNPNEKPVEAEASSQTATLTRDATPATLRASSTRSEERCIGAPVVSWRCTIISSVIAHRRDQAFLTLARLDWSLKRRTVETTTDASWLSLKEYWDHEQASFKPTSAWPSDFDMNLQLGPWQVQLTTTALEALLECAHVLGNAMRGRTPDTQGVRQPNRLNDDENEDDEESVVQAARIPGASRRQPDSRWDIPFGPTAGSRLHRALSMPILVLKGYLSRGQVYLDIFGDSPTTAVSAYELHFEPIDGFALVQLALSQKQTMQSSIVSSSTQGLWASASNATCCWRHQGMWRLETVGWRCLGPARTGFLNVERFTSHGLWHNDKNRSNAAWSLDTLARIHTLRTNMNGEDGFRLANRFEELLMRCPVVTKRPDSTSMSNAHSAARRDPVEQASRSEDIVGAQVTLSGPLDAAQSTTAWNPPRAMQMKHLGAERGRRRRSRSVLDAAGTVRFSLEVTEEIVLHGSKQQSNYVKASIFGRNRLDGILYWQQHQRIIRVAGCHEAMDLYFMGSTTDSPSHALLLGRFRLHPEVSTSWDDRWRTQRAWLTTEPSWIAHKPRSSDTRVPASAATSSGSSNTADEMGTHLDTQFAETTHENPSMAWRYAQERAGRTFILHLGHLELVYLHSWMKYAIPEVDAFLQSFVPDGPPSRPVLMEIQSQSPRVLVPRQRTACDGLDTTLCIESRGTAVYARRATPRQGVVDDDWASTNGDREASPNPHDWEHPEIDDDADEQWMIEAVTRLPSVVFRYGRDQHVLSEYSNWLVWIEEDETLDRTTFILRSTDGLTTTLCEADYIGIWNTIWHNMNGDLEDDPAPSLSSACYGDVQERPRWMSRPDEDGDAWASSSPDAPGQLQNDAPDPVLYHVDLQIPCWSSILGRGDCPQDEQTHVAHFWLRGVRLTADLHRSGAYATFLTATSLRIEDARPSAQTTRSLWPLVQDAAGLEQPLVTNDTEWESGARTLSKPKDDASEEERSRCSRLLLRYHRQWSSADNSQATNLAMDLRYLEILPVAQAIRSIAYLASPFELDRPTPSHDFDAPCAPGRQVRTNTQPTLLNRAALAHPPCMEALNQRTNAVVTLSSCRALFPACLASLCTAEQDTLEGQGDVMLTCVWQTNPSQFHYELFLDHFRITMARYDPSARWMTADATRDAHATAPSLGQRVILTDPVELVYPCAIRLMYVDTGDPETPHQFDISVPSLLVRLTQRDLVLVADVLDAYRRDPEQQSDWEHFLWHEDTGRSQAPKRPSRIRSSKTFSTWLRVKVPHQLPSTDQVLDRSPNSMSNTETTYQKDAEQLPETFGEPTETSIKRASRMDRSAPGRASAWHRWVSGQTMEAVLRSSKHRSGVESTETILRRRVQHPSSVKPSATRLSNNISRMRPADMSNAQQAGERERTPTSTMTAAARVDVSGTNLSPRKVVEVQDPQPRSVQVNMQIDTVVLLLLHEDTRTQLLPSRQASLSWADIAYGNERSDPVPVISYLPTVVLYGACSLQGMNAVALDIQLAIYVDIFNDNLGAWEPLVERCAFEIAWRNQSLMTAATALARSDVATPPTTEPMDEARRLEAAFDDRDAAHVLWHLSAVDPIELNLSEAFLPALDRLSKSFQLLVRESRLFRVSSTSSSSAASDGLGSATDPKSDAHFTGMNQGFAEGQQPHDPSIRRHPRPTLAALVVYNHTGLPLVIESTALRERKLVLSATAVEVRLTDLYSESGPEQSKHLQAWRLRLLRMLEEMRASTAGTPWRGGGVHDEIHTRRRSHKDADPASSMGTGMFRPLAAGLAQCFLRIAGYRPVTVSTSHFGTQTYLLVPEQAPASPEPSDHRTEAPTQTRTLIWEIGVLNGTITGIARSLLRIMNRLDVPLQIRYEMGHSTLALTEWSRSLRSDTQGGTRLHVLAPGESWSPPLLARLDRLQIRPWLPKTIHGGAKEGLLALNPDLAGAASSVSVQGRQQGLDKTQMLFRDLLTDSEATWSEKLPDLSTLRFLAAESYQRRHETGREASAHMAQQRSSLLTLQGVRLHGEPFHVDLVPRISSYARFSPMQHDWVDLHLSAPVEIENLLPQRMLLRLWRAGSSYPLWSSEPLEPGQTAAVHSIRSLNGLWLSVALLDPEWDALCHRRPAPMTSPEYASLRSERDSPKPVFSETLGVAPDERSVDVEHDTSFSAPLLWSELVPLAARWPCQGSILCPRQYYLTMLQFEGLLLKPPPDPHAVTVPVAAQRLVLSAACWLQNASDCALCIDAGLALERTLSEKRRRNHRFRKLSPSSMPQQQQHGLATRPETATSTSVARVNPMNSSEQATPAQQDVGDVYRSSLSEERFIFLRACTSGERPEPFVPLSVESFRVAVIDERLGSWSENIFIRDLETVHVLHLPERALMINTRPASERFGNSLILTIHNMARIVNRTPIPFEYVQTLRRLELETLLEGRVSSSMGHIHSLAPGACDALHWELADMGRNGAIRIRPVQSALREAASSSPRAEALASEVSTVHRTMTNDKIRSSKASTEPTRSTSRQASLDRQERNRSTWLWSCGIPVGITGHYALKLYCPDTLRQYIARLTLQPSPASVWTITIEPEDPVHPPMRLQNLCIRYSIAYRQLEASRRYWMLRPGYTARYAWDNPFTLSRARRLVLEVEQTRFELGLDGLGECVAVLPLGAERAPLQVAISLDGPTKVITFYDDREVFQRFRNGIVAEALLMAREAVAARPRRSDRRSAPTRPSSSIRWFRRYGFVRPTWPEENEVASDQERHLDFFFQLERIGVSFLTAEPAELAYMTMHRLLGGYTTNYKGCALELGIEGIELDNQRNMCVHPKVLRIRAQRLRAASAAHGATSQSRSKSTSDATETQIRGSSVGTAGLGSETSSDGFQSTPRADEDAGTAYAGNAGSAARVDAAVHGQRKTTSSETERAQETGTPSSSRVAAPAVYPALYLSVELGAPYSGNVWNVRFAFLALQTIEVCLEEDFVREAWPFLRLLFSADTDEHDRGKSVHRTGANGQARDGIREPGRQIYLEYLLFNPLSLRVSFFTSSMVPNAMTRPVPYQLMPGTISVTPLSGVQLPTGSSSRSIHQGVSNDQLRAWTPMSSRDLSIEETSTESSLAGDMNAMQHSAESSLSYAGRDHRRGAYDRYPSGSPLSTAHQTFAGTFAGANPHSGSGFLATSESPRFRGYRAFFRPLIAALGTVEDASLNSRALLQEHYLDSVNHWIEFIREFYLIQFRSSQIELLASSDLLGNPARLLDTVAEGVTEFLDTPRQATSSYDFLLRLNRASLGLFTDSVRGLFRTVSAVSASLSRGLTAISGDSQYIQKREERRRDAPSSITGGLRKGLESFGYEMRMAVTGLVREPYRGAQAGSLSRGIRRALTQAVVRPANGFLDLIMHPAASLGARPQHLRMPSGTRVRPPRCFGPGLRLVPYRLEDAQGNDLLWRLLNRKTKVARDEPYFNLEYYVGMFRVTAMAIYEAANLTSRAFALERLPLGPRSGVILVSTEHIYGLIVHSERPSKFCCLWRVHWSEVVQVVENTNQPQVLELLHSATTSYGRLLSRIKSRSDRGHVPKPIGLQRRLFRKSSAPEPGASRSPPGALRERTSTVQRLHLVCTSQAQREDLLQTLRQVFCTVARGRLFANQTMIMAPGQGQSISYDDDIINALRSASTTAIPNPGDFAQPATNKSLLRIDPDNRDDSTRMASSGQLIFSISAPPQLRAAPPHDRSEASRLQTKAAEDQTDPQLATEMQREESAEALMTTSGMEVRAPNADDDDDDAASSMLSESISTAFQAKRDDSARPSSSLSATGSNITSATGSNITSAQPGALYTEALGVGTLEGVIENRSGQALVLLWQHLDSGYFQIEPPNIIDGGRCVRFVVFRAPLPSNRRQRRQRQTPSPEKSRRARDSSKSSASTTSRHGIDAARSDTDPSVAALPERHTARHLRFRKLSGIILYALTDPKDQNAVYDESHWITLEFVISRRAIPRAHIRCPAHMRSMVQFRRSANTVRMLFLVGTLEMCATLGSRHESATPPRMTLADSEATPALTGSRHLSHQDTRDGSVPKSVSSSQHRASRREFAPESTAHTAPSGEFSSSESEIDLETSVIESYETFVHATAESQKAPCDSTTLTTSKDGSTQAKQVACRASEERTGISCASGSRQSSMQRFASRLRSLLRTRSATATLAPRQVGDEPASDMEPTRPTRSSHSARVLLGRDTSEARTESLRGAPSQPLSILTEGSAIPLRGDPSRSLRQKPVGQSMSARHASSEASDRVRREHTEIVDQLAAVNGDDDTSSNGTSRGRLHSASEESFFDVAEESDGGAFE
ncbi:vacuolar protein [Cyanidiococcus yangmingshanensis]|uniref:Vacuolar protein n=1 Tax=Cyanidiococcus yangmingshanensis TaxID=2690220 RepID=A0A7J7IML4_9RHOD|nr:vacuolar protein [Cyanidiococcus yangmingshanensis]